MGLKNTVQESLIFTNGFQGGPSRQQISFHSQSASNSFSPSRRPSEVEGPPPAAAKKNRISILAKQDLHSQYFEENKDAGLLSELEMQAIDNAVDGDLDPDQGIVERPRL